jgi:hypothetical protein
VHSVGEVDVGVAGRAEHDCVPLCLTPVGVRRGVRRAHVGLDLGDPYRYEAGAGLVSQEAAEEVGGHVYGGAVEEGAVERRRSGNRSVWPDRHSPQTTPGPPATVPAPLALRGCGLAVLYTSPDQVAARYVVNMVTGLV